jgi:ABC-2 type transport system permease protein
MQLGTTAMSTVLLVTINETRKGLLILWAYRINLLIGLLTMGITFVGVSFLMTNGTFTEQILASTLLGYLVWFFVLLVTSNMSENLIEEAHTGTLEQMFISPVPMGFILIGRTFATLIAAAFQIALVGGGIIVLMRIPFNLRWEGVVVAAITLIGLFGLGFLLGGLGLIFKQSAAIANLANNILIFLNGALVPIDRFPPWLAVIAQTLPSTQGIIVLRSVIIDGRSLADVWNDGSLVWLIIHSSVYFVGGWIVLKWCERIAKQQGTLGQY